MDKGSYIFPAPQPHESSFWPEDDIFSKILSISENVTIMETPTEKPLSEVEKAQASVNEWKSKVETYEKELHFAKKNLKVHEWALKKLQEIEK